MTRVILIAARARNGVIGNRGALPWRLSEDLAHFKRTTLGHCIVMGRKTWDSLGRPLPGRRNIVITRDADWQAPGAERAADLEDALAHCPPEQDAFIIGGGEIYVQALARGRVDSILLTEIDADFEGDTHFPTLDPTRWRETARTHVPPEGARRFGFDFVTYEAVATAPAVPR